MKLIIAISLFLTGQSTATFASGAKNWQLGFQEPATPVMEQIYNVHNIVLLIILGIAAVVFLGLVYILFRFRESKNPIPSKCTHNTPLEVLWTVIPCLLLIIIAIPTFKTMYFMDKVEDPDMTLKITSYQWYWNYEYPDEKVKFDSMMVETEDLKEGQPRLLTVDNPIVIPVNTKVRLILTSADVLHSWTIPSFGVKMDCIPGRLNEAWISVKREGIYHGQCSELCGMKHGYMPIAVKAVSKKTYEKWLKTAKDKFSI